MTKETIEVSDSLVLNYELGSKKVYYMNLVETIADNRDPVTIFLSEDEALRLIEALTQALRHTINLTRKTKGEK